MQHLKKYFLKKVFLLLSNLVMYGFENKGKNRRTGIKQVFSDTNGFINFWLRFMVTLGERHNSNYADLNNARRILWCLRSLSVEIRKSQHLSTIKIQLSTAEYTNLASMVQSQLLFFKSLKFSGPYLPGMTSYILQSHFLSGGLLWLMVIVIYFVHKRKTAPNDNASNS